MLKFRPLFKVAVRFTIKKWHVRKTNPEDVAEVNRRTAQLKEAFKAKGLLLFEPGQHGGSSMDGNFARRIFDMPQFVSEQTGLSVQLIKAYKTIWTALASTLPICPMKFQQYCDGVREMYDRECGWYQMPPTLHKILSHGGEILRLFPSSLSSGHFSEEPAEASNKDVKGDV